MREREAFIETAKAIAIGIAVVLVGMLLLLQASAYGARKVESYERQQNEIQIGHAVHITCQEDMPCWDCETMGNEICGRP